MNNSKAVKKSIIYSAPVILMHMIFTLIDKNIQINGNNSDLRLSIIHMSIYVYFFLIPIYLMIVNIIFNAKNKIEEYYKDVKWGALSILAGNIVVLIINIVSLYTIKSYEINIVIEFLIILIPELIMFIMFEFLGSYLVKKHDEGYEEETLEGLKIPEREIEFYKKDEHYEEDYEEDDEEKEDLESGNTDTHDESDTFNNGEMSKDDKSEAINKDENKTMDRSEINIYEISKDINNQELNKNQNSDKENNIIIDEKKNIDNSNTDKGEI